MRNLLRSLELRELRERSERDLLHLLEMRELRSVVNPRDDKLGEVRARTERVDSS